MPEQEQIEQVSYVDANGQTVVKLGEGYWEIDGNHWFAKSPDSITPQFQQVYTALKHAAEKIAESNYASQKSDFDKKYKNRNRKPKLTFTVTDAHQKVVTALQALCRDKITPEQAMAVLHEADVFHERYPDKHNHNPR